MNRSGMTLVELLISIGILGIVVAGTSSFFIYFQKNLSRQEAKQHINSLAQEIATRTSTKATCSGSIGTTQTYIHADASQDQLTQPQGGLPVSFGIPNDSIISGQTLTTYPLTVNSLKLYNSTLVGENSAATEDIYQVSLVGSFSSSKLPQVAYQPKKLAHFFVSVRKSDNLIQSCSGLNVNDAATLAELRQLLMPGICEDMGGTYNQQAKKCDGVGSGGDNFRWVVIGTRQSMAAPSPVCSGGGAGMPCSTKGARCQSARRIWNGMMNTNIITTYECI